MPGNSSYQYSHANNDFTAIAIEQFVKTNWENVQNRFCPILAAIKDKDTNFNQGFDVKRPNIAVPINYEDMPSITTATLGRSRSSMIPTSWPTFPDPQGFTHAVYPIAYLDHSIVLTPVDKRMLQNGERGNSVTGKVKALIGKWARTKNAMYCGNQNASETMGLGIPYAMGTSNTIGGIPQSTNTWWQGNTSSAISTLLESTIRSDFNYLARYGANDDQTDQNAPDLLLCDYIDGGFDVLGKVESFIVGQERYFHKDFFVKYGLTGFSFKNMKCMMNPTGIGGTYLMLNTSSWYYLGQDTPTQDPAMRILGSGSDELHFSEFTCLGAGNPHLNFYRTGITA